MVRLESVVSLWLNIMMPKDFALFIGHGYLGFSDILIIKQERIECLNKYKSVPHIHVSKIADPYQAAR